MDTLKRMENFCKTKKNMFLPTREDLTVALRVSPEMMACKKPEEKWPRTPMQPEELVEVPLRKNLRKKKSMTALRKSEPPKRARSEAVIMS